MAVAGDVALVGAEQDDDLGSACVFQRNIGGTNAWGFVRKLTASDGAVDDHFGYSVSAAGDAALVGAYGGEAAYVFQRNSGGTNAWGEVAKLTATDGTAGDHFGWSVAMNGGTALIGAYKDDDSGFESGSAYVFERNANGPNAWGQVRKLTASDGSSGDWFGCAVAASGNNALIGAYHDDPSGIFSGSAYVMPVSIETRSYQETSKLLAFDAAVSNSFGVRVSIDGDVALVGAYGNDSAYIFERNAGESNAWGFVVKLMAADGESNTYFGAAVSVDGDIALVGAGYGNEYHGAAYVFERNAGGTNNWGQVAKLTASDSIMIHSFGCSVSVAGNVALIGAIGNEFNRGSAYVFEKRLSLSVRDGGSNEWVQVAKLIADDGVASDEFGYEVALDGDVALIGAPGDDDHQGSAYVFERNIGGTNVWGQMAKLTASDGEWNDYFGIAIDVAGDVALVGANWDDGGYGSAYIFERNAGGTNVWGQVEKLTASDGGSSDVFGGSVSVAGDVALIRAPGHDDYRGAAYVFERNAGGTNSWAEVEKLFAADGDADDFFAGYVSTDGDVILIGAPWDSDAGVGAGSAYIFERHFPVPETAIEEMQIQGPEVVCAWTSEVPVDYTLQVSGSMDDSASWSNLIGYTELPGVDGMITVTNDLDAGPQRFYRVKSANSPLR